MARTRSERINRIKSELVDRLRAGFCRPGNHFVSNRELSVRYSVSYQTAHRLISELVDEGLLHRIPSSGTYVAGAATPPDSVAFVFHPNVGKNSFGGVLLRHLQTCFNTEGVPHELVHSVVFDRYEEGKYNIFWGQEYDLRRIPSHLQYSLMIDGQPEAGLNAAFTDCIAVDHFDVGVTCGKLLREKYGARSVAILAGHKQNGHHQAELAGFRQIFPECTVFHQVDWAFASTMESIRDFRSEAFDGVFSVTNVGADCLKAKFGGALPIVAYGDPEMLVQTGVDGVGIPWERISDEAIRLFHLRSRGSAEAGHHCIIQPEVLNHFDPEWLKARA